MESLGSLQAESAQKPPARMLIEPNDSRGFASGPLTAPAQALPWTDVGVPPAHAGGRKSILTFRAVGSPALPDGHALPNALADIVFDRTLCCVLEWARARVWA